MNVEEINKKKKDWIGFILYTMGYPKRASILVKHVTANTIEDKKNKYFKCYHIDLIFKTKKGTRLRSIAMAYFPNHLFV